MPLRDNLVPTIRIDTIDDLTRLPRFEAFSYCIISEGPDRISSDSPPVSEAPYAVTLIRSIFALHHF